MPVIISDASLLMGKDLCYVERAHLVIEDGLIKAARAGSYTGSNNVLDGRGFLIIPGLINAHTHIADSIGKDIAAGAGIDARIHPLFGAKKKILERTTPALLKAFIQSSAISMMKKGITAFADFREGGPEGIKLLREALSRLPIKCVALGRAGYYGRPEEDVELPLEAVQEAKKVLELAEGLGISGANENSDSALAQYRQLTTKKLVAIHAAESKKSIDFSKIHTGKTEVQRVMNHLKPDFVVHMTNATDDEISLVAKSGTGIVICPRANGVLGAGIPRVAEMMHYGCKVAIGTDNVMLNSPDILRELDYIWKVSRAIDSGRMISPQEILKMATSNAAEILRLNSGCIEQGRAADLVFVDKRHADLYPMHDPHASLVHRLSQSSISAVMIDGRFVTEAIN